MSRIWEEVVARLLGVEVAVDEASVVVVGAVVFDGHQAH